MTDYDAVIIGAGAGGGTCAYALTQQGLKVLLLEAGPRFSPSRDYPLNQEDWETQSFPEKPLSQGQYSFAPMQKLEPRWKHLHSWSKNRGNYVLGEHRTPSGKGYHHVRGVGGSTLRFTGEAHRFNQHSMQMASRFGVSADWPIDYPILEPFYTKAEKLIGVAGIKKVPGRPRNGNSLLPPHPFSATSRLLKKGANKLGLHWLPNSRAALSQPYDGRLSCNYCNNCNRGCPRGDKGSVDVTFIRKAEQTGLLEIRTECQVQRLESDQNNRITAVLYIDKQNNEHNVSAPLIILAAGAIETPRLLLNSASRASPQGLANDSGMVGKNFMETLSWNTSALVTDKIDSFKGLPSDGICWDYNNPDSIPGVFGGCRFSSSTAEVDLVGPVSYAQRIIPGWGQQLKRDMREKFGKVITIGAIGESLPNQHSFIDLDLEKKDQWGNPLARIHSFLPEMELNRLDFMALKCREILDAAGIQEIVEEYGSYDLFSSTHIFGTCRMGDAPETSVVNAYGQSHRWKNLFICDASTFPSSGGGESPSLTIEALALRTCHWININKSKF